MKHSVRAMLICLFLASLVIAKQEQVPGEPPFGLKIEGDAKGTKLQGSSFIEFYNFNPIPDARVVLRLRQGNTADLETIYGEVADVDPANPPAAQDAIVAAMGCLVIDRFFGNDNGVCDLGDPPLNVKLRSATEFGVVEGITTMLTPDGSTFVLTDLQLAVN